MEVKPMKKILLMIVAVLMVGTVNAQIAYFVHFICCTA